MYVCKCATRKLGCNTKRTSLITLKLFKFKDKPQSYLKYLQPQFKLRTFPSTKPNLSIIST